MIPSPKFNSEDLILLAHDEWKRREERKHNHPEQAWVAGFLSGFCTSKKWARAYVDKLRGRECPECGDYASYCENKFERGAND